MTSKGFKFFQNIAETGSTGHLNKTDEKCLDVEETLPATVKQSQLGIDF